MTAADGIAHLLRLKASFLVKRTSSELMEILDPGFVYINASGKRFNRQRYVTTFCGPEGIRFHSQSFDDLEIQDFGPFAVATMNVHDVLEFEGKMHDRDWLSRGMSEPASLRAHARRYRELEGREPSWEVPALNAARSPSSTWS